MKPLEDISWLGSVRIGILWLSIKALFVTRSNKNWRNVKRLALIANLFGQVGQGERLIVMGSSLWLMWRNVHVLATAGI